MKILYLCLHGLGTPPNHITESEQRYWLSSERFIQILQLCQKYQTQSRRIHVTFDDGNKSDVEIALPILQDFRFTATFFVIANMIGKPGFLSRTNIADLRQAGMIIGSHGAAHVNWTTLEYAELAEQINRSVNILSDITKEPIKSVAPPYGAYNRRVLGVLRKLSIAEVYTTDGGESRSDTWLKPRLSLSQGTPLEEIEMRIAGRAGWMDRLRCLARSHVRRHQ